MWSGSSGARLRAKVAKNKRTRGRYQNRASKYRRTNSGRGRETTIARHIRSPNSNAFTNFSFSELMANPKERENGSAVKKNSSASANVQTLEATQEAPKQSMLEKCIRSIRQGDVNVEHRTEIQRSPLSLKSVVTRGSEQNIQNHEFEQQASPFQHSIELNNKQQVHSRSCVPKEILGTGLQSSSGQQGSSWHRNSDIINENSRSSPLNILAPVDDTWKESLKKYPHRNASKPIILQHSPDEDDCLEFGFFDQATLHNNKREHKTTETIGQNVLFINNDKWMPGEDPNQNKDGAKDLQAGNIFKIIDEPELEPSKVHNEDIAYLKSVLINIRRLQARIEAERTGMLLTEDEEIELDTNISAGELTKIFNMCMEKKNRQVGFQVLYELLDHEELIATKVQKPLLSKILDQLKTEQNSGNAADSLIKRLEFLLR